MLRRVAAPVRTPRTDWVDAGLRALAGGGPDAVRVEALAQALGVTKGGFYWHVADRAALLEEMLRTWEERMVDRVISVVDDAGGDARDRLRTLFGLASAGGELMDVELAVRDWSRRDPTVATRVRRVDDRRVGYMRPFFAELSRDPDEAEARCLLAMTLFVGGPLVGTRHGTGRRRRDVVARAVEHLLR